MNELSKAVLAAINGGAGTAAEVYGVVAHLVSEEKALDKCRKIHATEEKRGAKLGRGCTEKNKMIRRGTSAIVHYTIRALVQTGKVKRLSGGKFCASGQKKKPNLRSMILDAVLAGASSAGEIRKLVGPSITASSAVKAGRRLVKSEQKSGNRTEGELSLRKLSEMGRSKLVHEALSSLTKKGKIARLGRGKYGPPQPKLFEPGQTA